MKSPFWNIGTSSKVSLVSNMNAKHICWVISRILVLFIIMDLKNEVINFIQYATDITIFVIKLSMS